MLPLSIFTKQRKAIVLERLREIVCQIRASPHLKLEPNPQVRMHGTFEESFVPAYKAGIASGLCETAAKTQCAAEMGQAPPAEAFLADLLQKSQAMRGVMEHQKKRAEVTAMHRALTDKRTEFTPVQILACQVCLLVLQCD